MFESELSLKTDENMNEVFRFPDESAAGVQIIHMVFTALIPCGLLRINVLLFFVSIKAAQHDLIVGVIFCFGTDKLADAQFKEQFTEFRSVIDI